MLQNGLGRLLDENAPRHSRFFDLFCGSGAVAAYVAKRHPIEVHASDLQQYAVELAASHLVETAPIDVELLAGKWFSEVDSWLSDRAPKLRQVLTETPASGNYRDWRNAIKRSRSLCSALDAEFPITRCFGAYYYSPYQAAVIDALRATICGISDRRALAALISSASVCAAAPGHTAQPLGLSDSSLPHIATAWARDPIVETRKALERFTGACALRKGVAKRLDATDCALQMREGDLAFIDPPYSQAQYSRFYHVLETLVTQYDGPVSGSGRYPPIALRPQSSFSRVSDSAAAFHELMTAVAVSGASAIVTFPAHATSNGLSGDVVEAISEQYFRVKQRKISSVFSTLGGKPNNRTSRHSAQELILHLEPK